MFLNLGSMFVFFREGIEPFPNALTRLPFSAHPAFRPHVPSASFG